MSTTSIAKKIRRNLPAIPEGEVFDFRRFTVGDNEEQALTKALSRMALAGEIVRVKKGKYYKPKQTRFGVLRPAESEIIKTLTKKNNKSVGYITGITLYNQLGLTTQVSNTLVIARNSRLPVNKIKGYKVRFVTGPAKFIQKDIPLLQLLDVIKNIKTIPDTSVKKSILVLVDQMKKLSGEDLKKMTKLALHNYNPATRALLGAVIELNFLVIPVTDLLKSLNPLSKYKLKIDESVLPNKSKWYIE